MFEQSDIRTVQPGLLAFPEAAEVFEPHSRTALFTFDWS